jgi:signal transduction histidine kinase
VTTRPSTTASGFRLSLVMTTRAAWGLWVVAVVVTLSAIVLVVITRSVPRGPYDQWDLAVLRDVGFLSYLTVGLIIAAKRPSNPLGWLLLLVGLILGLNELLHYYADYTLSYRPGSLPGGLVVAWVSTWIWALIFPILPLVFLLFPDGRLPSRRWRPLAWAAGLIGGLVLLEVPFRAGPLEYFPTIQNPVGISELTPGVFATLTRIYFVLLLLSAGSLLIRFKRAHREERQQLKWVAYTASLLGLQTLVGPWLPVDLNAVLSTLLNVAFAAAIAVAILKYRLYDIDRLINRTVVYGLLTVLLAGVYAGAVLVLGQLFGGIAAEPPSWAVAGATLAVGYPISVLVVLNAVALAWAAGQYPGRVIMLAPLIACYTLAALRGWRWGLAGAVGTALSALVAVRVAFGAAEPAGISGNAVLTAATAGAAGTAVGYYRALLVATRAQLAREAQTREAQARRRAVEERLRIARELHDVLGHTMATISVQAGVVPQAQLPAPQVAAFLDRQAASGGLDLDELAVLVEMDRLGPDVLDTAPGALPAVHQSPVRLTRWLGAQRAR